MFIMVALLIGMVGEKTAAPNFKGKVIILVVPTSAGGGTDINGRLKSRYLGKFIPGNPVTVVRNIVRFKELGLLIVDEEQRFGVKHKEAIKAIKKNVDVLTLTATPIPRTLHLSLTGIRDLSIIDTPPVDRQAIRTYVTRFDDDLVRDAILRELKRGGQVYFVHNRVQTIDAMAEFLRTLLPNVRIGVGHGQMAEGVLEQAMLDFIEGRTEVLLCTAIIENGLDIARANTIIIDRADTFGLAQLYQLRGRVGRSSVRAYAYLLIPGEGVAGSEHEQVVLRQVR